MESDEYEPYSFEACHYLLLNIVRDLSRASPSYEHGIEFIRNRMMDHFGVDGYDEAMAEVYKAIDDERWAWQVAGMDAMWSSWREHRQVNRCSDLMHSCPRDTLRIDYGQNLRIARARQGQINYIQNIPAVTGSSQGQFDYMQDGSRGQVGNVENAPALDADLELTPFRSRRCYNTPATSFRTGHYRTGSPAPGRLGRPSQCSQQLERSS